MGSKHAEIKEEIVAACRHLVRLGFVVGTYGNVSVRVPEGLIITPSRVEYAVLTPDDLVTVSLTGEVLEGHRLPSSEFAVHRGIYPARPDVNAVVHTHSFYATALSCLRQTVPVIVEEQSQVLGGEIRCTSYVPAGQHEKLSTQVAEVLGDSNAVLIASHGTVACGPTLPDTMFTCQMVERIAHMRLLTAGVGDAIPIETEFVRSERFRFLYNYGTERDKALGQ